MKTFGFPHPGPLTTGTYLLGSPRWSHGANLLQARVTCLCGSSLTATVLALEVGGSLTNVRISIQPRYAGEVIQNAVFTLKYQLPAGTEMRWKVLVGPDGAGAITRLGLTLVAAPSGTDLLVASALYVMWQNGRERLRLFEYTSATHTFSESSAGISSGRASLVNAPNLVVTIQSAVAMQNASGVLSVNLLSANGGSSAQGTDPRLEFYSGPKRLASLTRSGVLYVPDLTEASSIEGGTDRFEFYGEGLLASVLGGAGVNLICKELKEPV